MASHIDFLRYKKSLKWYKRLFWPLFLNDKELDYFIDKFGERTSLDVMRDQAYYDWTQYYNNPTTENRRRLDEDHWIIEKMREDEMLKGMSDDEKIEYMKNKNDYYKNELELYKERDWMML